MGFRFRRSVKLLPSVRLNVGLGRSSVSVGGRGARVNFSSKGVRTTVGIPGTGMSWTSSSRSSNPRGSRAPSGRELAARQRRAERETLKAQAEQEVMEEAREHEDLINCWRQMPALPTDAEYRASLNERPFAWPVPQAPDEAQERRQFREEIQRRVLRDRSDGGRFILLGVLAILIFKGVDNQLQEAMGSGAAVLGLSLGLGPVIAFGLKRSLEIQRFCSERFEEHWPKHWQAAQRAFAAKQQALLDWPLEERERIEFARRILDGEVEAVEEAVSTCLEELDFPFETQARVGVDDSLRAYILLDLPEIEDVIPEVKSRALANGTVKEVRRTRQDRNADYLTLVSGLALQLGRSAFCAGPTLQTIHVAAYTQRRPRGTGAVRDEYVYEVALERKESARWAAATVDPLEVFNVAKGRYDLRDNQELKAISPPDWTAEVTGGSEVAG
ncbi:DUF4236 domain-containing protein [Corallococcus sp. AB018]|nr:DUF4236 domain-containing protein [Corallococcus sp. AB018]